MRTRTQAKSSVAPPIEPMLAKIAEALPPPGDFLYEPKWDGFRAIVFREGAEVFIQSRDLRPLDRYFPDLHDALLERLPEGCVIDGEIVIATAAGLDFDALQMRLHPAASRVAMLAKQSKASFVAFDALALEWLEHFEGAGLGGVVAKPRSAPYQPGKRAMFKVKHVRTAECVVAGFRWYKTGPGIAVGSLLLGLYDDKGVLHHVGVTSSFTMAQRRKLAEELEPLRKNAMKDHPWRNWASAEDDSTRMPGSSSRWSAGKDLSWEALRAERVCEVKYDHLQGDRFRHAAIFLRWRPDKRPRDCRYDQLEVTAPCELARVFASSSS